MGAAVGVQRNDGAETNRSFQHLSQIDSPLNGTKINYAQAGENNFTFDNASDKVSQKKRKDRKLTPKNGGHHHHMPMLDSASVMDEYASDEEDDAEEGYESGTEMEASLHSYADFKIAEFAKEGPQNGKSLPSLQPAKGDTEPWISNIYGPQNFEPQNFTSPTPTTLKLEHIYGYDARRIRNNLFHVSDNRIVYTIGAVGVVFDRSSNSQRFFTAHDNEITSIAFHQKSGIVATGQIGASPKICVWDVNTMNHLATIEGFHKRAVVCLAFSPDGNKIASVGLDDNHSIAVYEWKLCRLISSYKGETYRVYAVRWNPYSENDQFVTIGEKHINFWSLTGYTLHPEKGKFGKLAVRKTLLSVTFTKLYTLTGTVGGEIYVWSANRLVHVIDAHNGPVNAIETFNKGIISGGKDGYVHTWHPQTFRRKSSLSLNKPSITNQLPYPMPMNPIRSLDIRQSKLLAGTTTGYIYEIGVQSSNLSTVVSGHFGNALASINIGGELKAVDIHPSKAFFASASVDRTLRIWNIVERKISGVAVLEGMPSAIAFATDKGALLAVGFEDGTFCIYVASDLKSGPIFKKKDRKGTISCIKFSPNMKYLAVASTDSTMIDMYSVNEQYKLLGHCAGHSQSVTHLDWSHDSQFLQSNAWPTFEVPHEQTILNTSLEQDKTEENHIPAPELLFFSVGDIIKLADPREVRDVDWFESSCLLQWSVLGAYDYEHAGFDAISSVARNKSKSVLVAAQKNGLLKTYRYPCVSALKKFADVHSSQNLVEDRKNLFTKYLSSGEDALAAKFAYNDLHVISAGKKDRCLYQWKVL